MKPNLGYGYHRDICGYATGPFGPVCGEAAEYQWLWMDGEESLGCAKHTATARAKHGDWIASMQSIRPSGLPSQLDTEGQEA